MKVCKAFKTKNRQRYKCGSCIFFYSVIKKSDIKKQAQRQFALGIYLEVLGSSRILKTSYSNVFYWVKFYGNQAKLTKNETAIEVAEVDEIHTYVGKKKCCWI